MAKVIKGNPRRKPPEPSPDHADVEDWLGGLVPTLQPIVAEVDRTICDTVPDLHFAVKYRRAFYGLPDVGWMIELAPYFVSANVLFFGGADFDPPLPLGSTGRTRYVKITGHGDVARPELREWIRQSSTTPGWPVVQSP